MNKEEGIPQPHVRSEDGEFFDVSINDGDVSFTMYALTEKGVNELLEDIKAQVFLLKESYKEDKK